MLGRKAAKRPDDDDDGFDDLLDGFEARKGLESSKRETEVAPQAKPRPKTAAVKDNLWGGDGDPLDDLDDSGAGPPETSSQRGPTDDARAAKRRALFGGAGASGS